MSAAQIIENLNRAGIQVVIDDGDLVLDAVISNKQAAYLRRHKAELITYLRNHKTDGLDDALAAACFDLEITPAEVRAALAPEGIEDFQNGNLSIETLTAFARSLLQQRDMANSVIPPTYTKKAVCRCCGPVWLWIEGTVDGCPWCFIRATGKLIPRPLSMDDDHIAVIDSGQASEDTRIR